MLVSGQWASIKNGQTEAQVLTLIGRPTEVYECGFGEPTFSAFSRAMASLCILTEHTTGDFKFATYKIPDQNTSLYLSYNKGGPRGFILVANGVGTLLELSAEIIKYRGWKPCSDAGDCMSTGSPFWLKFTPSDTEGSLQPRVDDPNPQPRGASQSAIPNGQLYVLMVYEEEGIYTSVSASEERAFEDLVAYVKNNWSKAFPGVAPTLDDDEQLIDTFFDRKDAKEEYEILELPLLK